jgi:hypothetical protein
MSVEPFGNAGRAVFLSYASQHAEAARRICEALRAAGVEVWFSRCAHGCSGERMAASAAVGWRACRFARHEFGILSLELESIKGLRG